MHKIYWLFWFFLTSTAFAQVPLDSASLAKQPEFSDLEAALATPEKVYKLNLSQASLKTIPEEIRQFKYLQVLYLGSYADEYGYYQKSNNRISALPAFIGDLANLQYLYLNENSLQDLPDAFCKLKNLIYIGLSSNKIKSLPTNIGNLQRLRVLVLYENKLEQLPESLGDLSNLEELYVHKNAIKVFPASITKLSKLHELSFSDNQIADLPTDIGKLVYLHNLNMSGNRLKRLPIGIGELKNLQMLNLSSNQLYALPAAIGELVKLIDLNVSDNQLKSLPTLSGLVALEELRISGNLFKNLPESLCDLIGLKRLIASQNQLIELPNAIDKLVGLELMEVSQNQLKSLPSTIGALTQLQNFSANLNKLTTLPESLGKLPNLKNLFLERNLLQTLPASFEESTSLKVIYISQNPLKNITVKLLNRIENVGWSMLTNIETDMREQYINQFGGELYASLKPHYEKIPLRYARLLNYSAWWHKENKQYKRALELGELAHTILLKAEKDSVKVLPQKPELQNEINDTRYKVDTNLKAIKAIKENLDLQARITLYTQLGAILIVIFVSIVAFLLYRNAQAQKAKNKIIEIEKSKSEKLLLNILPKEVAQELKDTGETDVKHFPHTSILFADVQGFSARATKVTPQQLVNELNTTFTQMDNYAMQHKLERIKTIGDCYMAVGGCPEVNNTHPVDICLAALEIQHWMLEERSRMNGAFWQIRLGIHTGELVAGVIGKLKFAYDVWGGAVNTASRMESGGEVGKVNISATTYSFVQDFFDCTFRGEIEAKNIGLVKTYFVNSIKPELSQDKNGLIPNDKFKALYKTKFGEIYKVKQLNA